MGLKDCRIFFDNPQAIYYGGQTVSGRVELTLDAIKKVRAITIKCRGEGNCNWTRQEDVRGHDGKTTSETVHLSASEEYFKTEYALLKAQGDHIEIPVGQHVYPFTCVLPPTLPSSFEGSHGYVRYTVKVTLDRPWKFDQECKVAFTVLAPLDLNLNPRLRERAQLTVEKFFCCCFCQSGPLTCVVTVPYTGFVSGQIISITCEIDNMSNVAVDQVKFKLVKKVKYYSQIPRRETKEDEVEILNLSCPGVAAKSSNTFNQQMIIPALPPSNLTNCSIIDLNYELQITAVVSGMHSNLESKIPLTIGTIPFAGGPPPMGDGLNNSASVAINMPPPTAPGEGIGWQAPDMPPPSYEQSQFGTTSIKDSSDNAYTRFDNNMANYSPLYPVFQPSAPPLQN